MLLLNGKRVLLFVPNVRETMVEFFTGDQYQPCATYCTTLGAVAVLGDAVFRLRWRFSVQSSSASERTSTLARWKFQLQSSLVCFTLQLKGVITLEVFWPLLRECRLIKSQLCSRLMIAVNRFRKRKSNHQNTAQNTQTLLDIACAVHQRYAKDTRWTPCSQFTRKYTI